MARTYPLTFPTIEGVRNLSWHAISADAVSMSPYTFQQQIIDNVGQRFDLDIGLPPLTADEVGEFAAFALKLNGRVGTFTFIPPDGAVPRGTALTTPGTPVVNGAGQSGDSLNIDGLPLSATGYLKAGDYISLGSGASTQLYKCVTQVDSDGSGQATVDVWPNLRTVPANGSTVVVSGASGLFRMGTPEVEWGVNGGPLYGMSMSLMEAL